MAAPIFDTIRRGEGDTVRVSGASGVIQLENPPSARDSQGSPAKWQVRAPVLTINGLEQYRIQ